MIELADLKVILIGVAGFAAKMFFDYSVNLFKSTISTPARVLKMEEDFKREMDAIKEWKALHERDIKVNWDRYNEIEKRYLETQRDSRKAS